MSEGNEQCDGADLGGWTCWTAAHQEHGTLVCADDCTFDTTLCHTCGDGVLEGSEPCDGSELGGATCASQGYAAGELGCSLDCELDTSACVGPPTCGNGTLDPGQSCEGVDLGGATCATLGLAGSGLACTPLCVYDTIGCWPSVCGERSTTNPYGRPPVQLFVHPTRDVQIAVHADAVVQDMNPQPASSQEAAVSFDVVTSDHAIAGFMIMRPAAAISVELEAVQVAQTLMGLMQSTPVPAQTLGSIQISHDGFENAVLTTLHVFPPTQDLGTVRNAVVSALLNRPESELTLPADLGYMGTNIIIQLTTQWRNGVVVVMGAVATIADHQQNPAARRHLEDAANGSGIAQATALTQTECNTTSLASVPTADIIWVLDESGSMDIELLGLSTSASGMFDLAAVAGLDFRMGITDVHIGNNGIFCTAQGQSNDYFLSPSELSQFQACALEPWGSLTYEGGTEHGITQGYNAILNHLPRVVAPNRIRPGAALVLVYFSDEPAQEVQTSCGYSPPWDPNCIQTEIMPTLNLLLGVSNPEAVGTAHAVVGPPPSGCSTADMGGGYIEIANNTGGQVHNICQTNLDETVQRIMEDAIGLASPIVLSERPISATIALAIEDKTVQPSELTPLARSRTNGFEYDAIRNSIMFFNQDLSQLPYEIVISFERWTSN